MKKYMIWIGMALLAISGSAQNFGEIQGKVVDANGEALPSAYITTETASGEMNTTTDLSGKFKLKPLVAGTYNLVITFIGHAERTISGIKVEPDKIKYLADIVLTEEGIITDGADVYGHRDALIEKDGATVITKRHAEIIQSPLAKTPMKYIAVMTPGAYEKDGELYFKGSRAGAVQYHVDGVKMTTNVSRIPSTAIGSISVYTGGIPAKYGDTTGGVVVLETRSFMDLYNEAKYASN